MLRCLLLVVWMALPVRASAPVDEAFFESKIRPLFVTHCQACHSAKHKIKGGLSLDSRADLHTGGDTGPAVPDLLLKAVGYADPDLRMPPKGKLSAEQIADLTAWVKAGTPWPKTPATAPVVNAAADVLARRTHWSFQPLHYPAYLTSIDAFIAARRGELSAAPPATKAVLLRRLYFDVIGLPPTVAEQDAFLTDVRPDAVNRLIERLLASPHYGERWGRHWLDIVRYAETSGHEFDFDIPDAWRYRDYVVRALNADLPYDQFVREHLAGDLLPEPRRHPATGANESILATGAFFLGESKHSPVDLRVDTSDRFDNMIDVVSKGFLGLTLTCARCHDHKFDPILQKDYFALFGYLKSSRQQRAFIDDPAPTQALMHAIEAANERFTQATAAARQQALTEQIAQLPQQAATWTQANDLRRAWTTLSGPGDFVALRKQLHEQLRKPAPGLQTPVTGTWDATGYAFAPVPTARWRWSAERPFALAGVQPASLWRSGQVAPTLAGVVRSPTFTLTTPKLFYLLAGQNAKVNLIIDSFQQIREPIYGGLTIRVNQPPAPKWFTQDVSMWQGHRAYIELSDDGPGWLDLRAVHAGTSAPAPATPTWLLELTGDGQLTTFAAFVNRVQSLLTKAVAQPEAQPELLADWLAQLPTLAEPEPVRAARQTWSAEVSRLSAQIPVPNRALALADGTGENERLHIRGNPNSFGAEVSRGHLSVLDATPASTGAGSGRFAYAQRFTDPRQPLLARVIVNRVWHHHFGAGLVRTPDDFGAQGQAPTHPELLDWLAAEFVREGWSLKSLHRKILLSATYQQASTADPATTAADPLNLRWQRQNVRRLEAEAIRDAVLHVSGRLDLTLAGPSVPTHLTEHMTGRGRPSQNGPLDGAGRRTLYLNIQRNFLHPFLLAFDAPIPFAPMGRRNVSNVPAQALALLNNPFIVQQANRWGERVRATANQTDAERITSMYRAAFARVPSVAELAAAQQFLTAYEPTQTAQAWGDFAHVLFNVKEFIFVP
jgi:mono/diheme cytochrome c family protein